MSVNVALVGSGASRAVAWLYVQDVPRPAQSKEVS